MMSTRSPQFRPLGSPSELEFRGGIALTKRTPDRDPQFSKELPPQPESASQQQKVVAEATRLLSLLMEFAELERLRQEKEKAKDRS